MTYVCFNIKDAKEQPAEELFQDWIRRTQPFLAGKTRQCQRAACRGAIRGLQAVQHEPFLHAMQGKQDDTKEYLKDMLKGCNRHDTTLSYTQSRQRNSHSMCCES